MTSGDWTRYWSARRGGFVDECARARAAFIDSLARPDSAQNRVLADIVRISSESAHWRELGIRATTDPDRFRESLPVMRYEDFMPLIDREIHAKGGVLSCSPVPRWLKTGGTTGTPKRIPYSVHWMENYRTTALQTLWGTYLENCPEMVAHPHATLDTQTVREPTGEFLQGAEYQPLTNRHPLLSGRDWNPPWQQAPWFGTGTPTDHEGRMYHRIRHLLGRGLRFVAAVNPSTLISLRDLVAVFGDSLVSDLRTGSLRGEPYGQPDPAAADHLERVLGDPDFSLVDLWPTLVGYSCWVAASTRLYRNKLAAILPGVQCVPFMSCGTEGVTALPVDDDHSGQPLAVTQAFFEFVPAEVALGDALADGAGRDVRTLLFDELAAGRDYHMVMSQANGLYRLWIGDIYHVDRIESGVPWIRLRRRDGVYHSFTGEKITEAQVTDALATGFASLGIDMGLYMCGPKWSNPPGYVVLVESAGGHGLDARIARAADDALKALNIEYAAKRDSGRLDQFEVRVVPVDAISGYVESKRRQVKNSTQYKYKPFQTDIGFVDDVAGVVR